MGDNFQMVKSRIGKIEISGREIEIELQRRIIEIEDKKGFFEKDILKIVRDYIIENKIEVTNINSCQALQIWLRDNQDKGGCYNSSEVEINITLWLKDNLKEEKAKRRIRVGLTTEYIAN